MLTTTNFVKQGYVTTVIKTIKYEALWQVSDNDQNSISGYLHIDPEGIWLALNGSFRSSLEKYECILGTQANGYKLTLEDCILTKTIQPFGSGYPVQVFWVKRVYGGIHSQKSNKLKFSNFDLSLTHLKYWLRNVGLSSPKYCEKGVLVNYDPKRETTVSDLVFHSIPDVSIEIISGLTHDFSLNPPECNIRIKDYVHLNCDNPISIDELNQKVINPLRNFLNLATTSPNSITSLSSSVGQQQVTIHFQDIFPRQADHSLFNKQVILFLAKDIQDKPDYYFEKWIKLNNEINDICELFFSVHYDQGSFQTNRFLNIVQALEAYSRIRHGKYARPKEEHKKRSEEVLESIPEKHKKWVRQILNYSNNKNLRNRLFELIEEANPLSKELVGCTNEFAKYVVDTRNYLTHRDSTGKNKIASGETIDLLIHTLLWIFRIHFLLEIGFDHSECRSLLQNVSEYNWLCSDPEKKIPWKNIS